MQHGRWDCIKLSIPVGFREEEIKLVKVMAFRISNEVETIKLIGWEEEKSPKKIAGGLVGFLIYIGVWEGVVHGSGQSQYLNKPVIV